MTIPDFQRYPEKICLIKDELDINVYNFIKFIIFHCGFFDQVTSLVQENL